MTRAPSPRRRPPADTLAAELALGVLDADERAAAEARAAADPDFAAEAAAWSARLHPLSEEARPVEPSADLWPRIAAALPAWASPTETPSAGDNPSGALPDAPAAAAAQIVELAPRRQERRWRRIAGLATGLAAACVVGVVVLLARHPVVPQPLLTARLEPPASDSVLVGAPLYTVTVDRTRAAAVLTPVGPGPVDPRARELWVIAKADAAPQAVGVIARDRPLHFSRKVAALVHPGVTLAVSLEPAGGSPTGAPTGPVIATGVLSGA